VMSLNLTSNSWMALCSAPPEISLLAALKTSRS
jgi:hypothetical protein